MSESQTAKEGEAWFEQSPEPIKPPLRVTDDEIVIPLADFLMTSDLARDVNENLEKRMVYHSLPKTEDHEQMEDAVRILLEYNPDLIMPEQLERAVELPRNMRGECLFDCLIMNTSTGRDPGVF